MRHASFTMHDERHFLAARHPKSGNKESSLLYSLTASLIFRRDAMHEAPLTEKSAKNHLF